MLNDDKTLKILKKINSVNDNIVFVGGISELIQGKREFTTDIDICVLNIDGFSEFGEIKEWITESPVSLSGNRAGIKNDEFILDIFIENSLPKWVEISGLKFETIDSLILRYERVIKAVKKLNQVAFLTKLEYNLKNLKNNI